jgi:hypothetical protein
MTEAEWLTATDPGAMLEFVQAMSASDSCVGFPHVAFGCGSRISNRYRASRSRTTYRQPGRRQNVRRP